MPINTADQLEAGYTIALMRYYATLAGSLQTEESRPSPLGFNTLVRREPVGVVGAIVPWNFPVILSMMKIGPALTAGCTLGGAAAGGVIGNEATNHSAVGTVGGAVAGGIIGHEFGK